MLVVRADDVCSQSPETAATKGSYSFILFIGLVGEPHPKEFQSIPRLPVLFILYFKKYGS